MQDNVSVTFDVAAWTSAAFHGFTQYLNKQYSCLQTGHTSVIPSPHFLSNHNHP